MTPKGGILQSERKLAYYPLSIKAVNNVATKTNYLIVSGSNKQVQILSREGVKLADVSKVADSWIWSADSCAEEDTLAYGTNHGLIEFVKTKFDSVNSMSNDRFAYRENLTEVIVHHLITDKKVRIKCKDMIHHLSLFRNKLAVQLLDRICVYETNIDDEKDIHFRLRKERIILASASFNVESKAVTNLMIVTTNHVFTCLDQFLELYHQDGRRVRLWKMDAVICSLNMDGGKDGKEGILVGLVDGKVFRFYVDQPFPVEVAVRKAGVVFSCQNIYRTLIATIDHHHNLVVSETATQEIIYAMEGVQAACFNSEIDDLMCVTNANGTISVIAGLTSSESGTKSSLGRASSSALASPEVQEQHIQGKVVGFHGQKIFSTQRGILSSVDIPQEKNIQKALENSDFPTAYKIACLGATETDWRLLAMRALRGNHLLIAKNSFARLKDTRYLSLIEMIERHNVAHVGMDEAAAAAASHRSAAAADGNSLSVGRVRDRSGGRNAAGAAAAAAPLPIAKQPSVAALEPRWLAEIMAMEGHYNEAAKLFARSGNVDESIRMFTLLRKFEEAKAFARSTGVGDVAELTTQQAKWLQEIKDWKGASDLFIGMGQYAYAARIIGDNANPENGADTKANKVWSAALLEIVRSCPMDDKETLTYCAEKLSILEDIAYAKEACIKATDYARLMTLYVQREMWTDAAKLADEYQGKFDMSVFASYAEWLVSQDRYEEAMEAFKKSGRMDLSRKVLTELTLNAVAEHRFKDAGYYYWMLAKELEVEVAQETAALSAASSSSSSSSSSSKSASQRETDGNGSNNNNNNNSNTLATKTMLISECEHKADLYYAYAVVYAYVMEPFTTYQPEMLFQVSRFIINSLGISDAIPQGISKTFTLYTLAKQAMRLGAYKLARNAYDRLSRLKIPSNKMEEVELDMLLVQAKPVRDDPEHLPVCYRCGSVNPLLNPFTNRFAKGDVCTNCGHPFVRSFINFDILPLVEFVPEPQISDDEAIEMIRQPASRSQVYLRNNGGGGGGAEGKYSEGGNGGRANILSFDDAPANHTNLDQSLLGDQESNDLFTHCLNATLERQVRGERLYPICVLPSNCVVL
jgi:intraflagellar transport protein 122